MSSAQKPFTVGGIGAHPSLDDVVRISQGQIVALDPAGADRVKKLSPAPKQFQAEPAPSSSATSAAVAPLDAVQIRAIIASKLLVLINGRSGTRLQVCDFLSQLLNGTSTPHGSVLPALHPADTDAAVLRQLADACHGMGEATAAGAGAGSGSPLTSALEAASVAAPGLSAMERAVIESGASASAGVSALTVQV